MKEEELKQLQKFLDTATHFELPAFDRLPSVPLYMEQVITYVNSTLEPLSLGDKQLLTSFMVNNYVKAKIIREPDRKKYSVEHLGYLLAITTLKSVLSMSDIAMLISMDKDVSLDKSALYRFFKTMSSDVFKDVGEKAKRRIDAYAANYEKERNEQNPDAEKHLIDSIGLIALRMSIQSAVYQLLSQSLLQFLACNNLDENDFKKEFKPGVGEIKHQRKQAKHEAERVALLKKKERKTTKKTKKR